MLLKQKPKETENKMLNSDYVWTKTRAGFLTKDVDSNNKEKKLSKEKHSIQSFGTDRLQSYIRVTPYYIR